FFFQADDGIRYRNVTGVQTCALPISIVAQLRERLDDKATAVLDIGCGEGYYTHVFADVLPEITTFGLDVSKVAIKAAAKRYPQEIGRASCREKGVTYNGGIS